MLDGSNGLPFPESGISSNAPFPWADWACFRRLSVLLVDGASVLVLSSLKSSWRTKANQVGLETTIGRSPTVGSNEVSFVVRGRRHTRWLVSLHASSPTSTSMQARPSPPSSSMQARRMPQQTAPTEPVAMVVGAGQDLAVSSTILAANAPRRSDAPWARASPSPDMRSPSTTRWKVTSSVKILRLRLSGDNTPTALLS